MIFAVWGVIVYEPKHIPLKEQRSQRHSYTDRVFKKGRQHWGN